MGSCSNGPRSPAGLPFAAALRTPNASTADPTPEPSEARIANVRPSSMAEFWHPSRAHQRSTPQLALAAVGVLAGARIGLSAFRRRGHPSGEVATRRDVAHRQLREMAGAKLRPICEEQSMDLSISCRSYPGGEVASEVRRWVECRLGFKLHCEPQDA